MTAWSNPVRPRTIAQSVNETPSTIGKLFIYILIIVVVEGALRKWVSPVFTGPTVLLRDVLAFYGVYWAFKQGKMRFTQRGTQALWAWTVIVLLWGLFQLMINQNSPLVQIIGLRFWLLYLWFSCAAAISMNAADFRLITKTLLYMLLVMTPLAIVQFSLPPTSFINKEVAGDSEEIFRVTADIVRTTGSFSFTLGYTTFLAFVTPFVLALLAPLKQPVFGKWISIFFVFTLAIGTMISGSRAALIMFVAMFVAYLFISLRYSKSTDKAKPYVMLVVSVLILSSVPYLFPRAVDASLERFKAAAESEDFAERVSTIFLGESELYDNISLVGEGIGSGTLFASVLLTGGRSFMLAETESSRTILEGGALGFIFIGIKVFVIVLGLRKSLRIARSTGDPLPLLLWITLAVGLLTWSVIGQLTVNALGYLLLGLGIASLRVRSGKPSN